MKHSRPSCQDALFRASGRELAALEGVCWGGLWAHQEEPSHLW